MRRRDRARNQVDLGVVILAELAVGIRAGRVEITQRHREQSVCALEVRQRTLDRELGLAVAVDRLLRMGFGNRRFDRLAVGRAGGREDEPGDRLGRHRLEDAQRAADVVAVVARRFAHRFADVEIGREVHHRLDPVSADRRPDCAGIQDVSFDQLAVAHRLTVAGAEVVVDDRLVAAARERLAGVAADVAGAAGYEHPARLSGQWRSR